MSLVECPYVEGAKYVLEFKSGTDFDEPFKSSSKLQITVLKTFHPFTISPVFKVRLDRSDPETIIPEGSIIILKLFDSRFATDLRQWHAVPDLTLALATEYSEFLQRESKTFEEWDAKRIQLRDEDRDLAPLEKEAHLDTLLRSYYQCETRVYEKLIELQGRGIPKFFGQTRFVIDSFSHSSLEATVPGILLEYIEGQSLQELPLQLFHESIATSALEIVSTLSDKEILNQDVRLDNFIVPTSRIDRPVVMIDFAQCIFRGEEMSDEEWYDRKAITDEEGAVGSTLRTKVGWEYRPSRRYIIRGE
ncbi:hypothetical protein Agabi119p4_8615 [Agaricus bisporus var. burnettii]|uniref:Protein kinase domain-containing protein n=1 Tax=Agaricus bisporus var. burnettii TaxID=192524 RepID=A0A8H7C8B3_AGABI|nr:hypothetical protein Agabi119p4_8615 [Agaricus bisporus var. burnettii]